jgi:hypothetical protein
MRGKHRTEVTEGDLGCGEKWLPWTTTVRCAERRPADPPTVSPATLNAERSCGRLAERKVFSFFQGVSRGPVRNSLPNTQKSCE